jgi:hypothetical protein
MGWSLSAGAEGSGPGALMLVVGAILLVTSWLCFRGVDLLHALGSTVGDFGCFMMGLLGVGLIIMSVIYFFQVA